MPIRILLSVIVAVLLFVLPAAAADSPQFRGPQRDGIYPAEGLLQSWPKRGPKMLWSTKGLGQGFASVAVADGRIYSTGIDDGRGSVHAHDLRGKHLWSTDYGKAHDAAGYPGARTTPTFDDGLIYIMSSTGKAAALDAASGKIAWQQKLPIRDVTWGISESPLVVDGLAIFTPGGAGGTMVALDKKSGKRSWGLSEPREASAYCSPRLFDDGERRQIITMTAGHMIGVDPLSGALLWKYAVGGDYGIHAVSPAFDGRSIYVSDGYRQGGKMLKLAADGASVALTWQEKKLDVHHGGVVWVDGRIYGAASNGTWLALDARSGKVLAKKRRLGKGSVVYADGRLYGYTEKGEMLLVDPHRLQVVSRFDIDEGSGQHWAHPVIAAGILYVRHGDSLMAFDLRGDGFTNDRDR